jgi:putative SOS response-associated peptidase YedK
VLGTFQWGLVPSWAKDPKIGNRMINARAETVASKPAYRRAFAGHRTSLLPADSFFEWQRHPAKAGKPASKLPYAIHRADGQAMAFAALWEVWRDKDNPDAEPLRTCVIITTAANDLMKPIHDRLPVILDPADWDTWLDPGTDLDTLQRLLVPAPAGDLEAYPVRTRVNNVRNDSPELLDPLPSPPARQPAVRPGKTAERVKTKSGGR